jgi:hypothetical protein
VALRLLDGDERLTRAIETGELAELARTRLAAVEPTAGGEPEGAAS